MYGLLWRAIPGPAWVRVVLLLLLAAAAVVALFAWVFPAVEPHVPWNDTTVGEG